MKTKEIYPVKCEAYFTGTKETKETREPPDLIFQSLFYGLTVEQIGKKIRSMHMEFLNYLCPSDKIVEIVFQPLRS
jgi:hypothetical protein